MNAKYLCFFWGFLFSSALRMFFQDMMGLDKYINYVKSGWVDISPWLGFGVMVVALIGFAKTKYNKPGNMQNVHK